jgi:hypothetical protein
MSRKYHDLFTAGLPHACHMHGCTVVKLMWARVRDEERDMVSDVELLGMKWM